MIFVTVGTHPAQFDRLIKRIDEIAPKIKEKIIIQRGFTKYIPKNAESFIFAPNLEPYFKKARLVISHSATTLLEFVLFNKKPLITVPRRRKFGEHINDHQVEFAEFLEAKTGIRAIINIKELNANLLENYNVIAKIKKDNFNKLQDFFAKEFNKIENEQK